MKIKIGQTNQTRYERIDGEIQEIILDSMVDIYECDNCKARDYDSDECFWCRNAIKAHHKEEAESGLI